MVKLELMKLIQTLDVNGFLNKEKIVEKYCNDKTFFNYHTLLIQLIEDYMRNRKNRITIYGSVNSGKTILLNYIRYKILEKSGIESDFIFIDGLNALEMKEEYISKFKNKYEKVSEEVIKPNKFIHIVDKIPYVEILNNVLYIKVDSDSIETKQALEYIIFKALDSDGFHVSVKNENVKNITLDENIVIELHEQQLPKA